MGLLDRLKKGKDNAQQRDTLGNWDISYVSKSEGVTVKINFADELYIEGKRLQRAFIAYQDNKENNIGKNIEAGQYLLEPSLTQNENGEIVNTTKQYYQKLVSSNTSLLKGFFHKTSLENLKTNYIGAISTDNNGKLSNTRYIDIDFQEKYIKLLERKQIENEENRLKLDLASQVEAVKNSNNNPGYQQICNNLDSRNRSQRQDSNNVR